MTVLYGIVTVRWFHFDLLLYDVMLRFYANIFTVTLAYVTLC